MCEMKRCSKCGEEKPATTEYFHWRKDNQKFRNICKVCAYERSKKWRKDNPEIYKQANRNYYERNKEKHLEYSQKRYYENYDGILAQRKEYRERTKEHKAKKDREYREKNREKIRKRKREYYQRTKEQHAKKVKQWQLENPEKVRKYKKKWEDNNPGKRQNYWRVRRNRVRCADGDHTAGDIEIIMKSQLGKCWWCGKDVGKNYHVDHRIPIVKGGTNNPENLCISCPECNQSKGGKMPHEWNGRLL